MPADYYCIKCRCHLKGLSDNRCPECGVEFDPKDPLTYSLSPWMLHPAHTLIGGTLLLLILIYWLDDSGDFTMYLDSSSLLWVVGIVIAGLWMCFGPFKTIKAVKDAVLGYRYDNVGDFSISIAVLARGYQLTWAAGLSGTLLGLVRMLANMDDPAAIGPGMAVSLLASIYAVILAEFFFSPLQQVMIARVNVPMEAVPWLTVPQRSMMLLCVAGALLLGCTFIICFMGLWPYVARAWPIGP